MNTVYINLNIPKGKVEDKIFGHFCEHAFGNIYGGFYDPKSEFADEKGYRKDVIEALKEVKPPLMRYPGGNFVSNYHWEDGIGPKENRKRVYEYAWLTEESNQFGTADFIEICRRIGAEPLLCVNMGTGSVEEAMHWVEYCNGTGNTYYANLRRSHGYEEPFHVKYWGLGNEPYGAWQMNNYHAAEYAEKAFQFAKAMKWVDPSVKLIASGYEQTTDWGYTITSKLWQMVDYVSAHHYACVWGPFQPENYLDTMCIADYMEKLNQLVYASILTGVNNTTHIKIAWDEWNMFGWALEGVNDDSSYTLQNALVTALILNMFIRNSETIGMANYSTFVNITGALSVTEEGILRRAQFPVFKLLREKTGTILYQAEIVGDHFMTELPQSMRLGREKASIDLLDLNEGCDEKQHKSNYIDVTVTGDKDGCIYVSLINKHPEKDEEVDLRFYIDDGQLNAVEGYEIYGDDISAGNTRKHPNEIEIKKAELPTAKNNICRIILKKHSITVYKFSHFKFEQYHELCL